MRGKGEVEDLKVIFIWFMLIMSLLVVGVVLDNITMMATHNYVQGAADAATDAGALQRQIRVHDDDIHEFVIEPLGAKIAAVSTFNKNLNHMDDLKLDTSRIKAPDITFPDEYSIQLNTDLSYDPKYSSWGISNAFGKKETFPAINDSIAATSNINHKK